MNGSSAFPTMPPSSKRQNSNRRGSFLCKNSVFAIKRSTMYCILLVLIIISICMLPIVIFILPSMPPTPPLRANRLPCRDDTKGYTLGEMDICTHTCGTLCFPRVRGICFSHEKVTICDGRPLVTREVLSQLPSEMVFKTNKKARQKISIQHGNSNICDAAGAH